ncbi:hypothetical protein [Halorubrum ezzemoulense]|uniref:hypothetical protein n=1 Tax=Halorubrum ezzemoulense TaxID=337243 RepID=UPI0023303449|nr:hypothetical protein [Halorubrum ezzemoulense]MDB2239501.1 hypothetical protein [Halorubrum ezzemoulense]
MEINANQFVAVRLEDQEPVVLHRIVADVDHEEVSSFHIASLVVWSDFGSGCDRREKPFQKRLWRSFW